VRKGLVVIAEVRLQRTGFVAQADAALTSEADVGAQALTSKLRDTPMGLAVLRAARGTRWAAAAGPRAALHIFDVSAAGEEGHAGGARRFSAGIGGQGTTDLYLTRYVRLWLAVTVEALLPARQFTLAGESAVHTGTLLVGSAAGFALTYP